MLIGRPKGQLPGASRAPGHLAAVRLKMPADTAGERNSQSKAPKCRPAACRRRAGTGSGAKLRAWAQAASRGAGCSSGAIAIRSKENAGPCAYLDQAQGKIEQDHPICRNKVAAAGSAPKGIGEIIGDQEKQRNQPRQTGRVPGGANAERKDGEHDQQNERTAQRQAAVPRNLPVRSLQVEIEETDRWR